MSIHVLAGTGCSLGDQFQDFPQLPSGHPVTGTQKIQGVETGTDGQPTKVLCTWMGTQAPFSIDAVITIGPAGAQRFVNLGSPQVQGQSAVGGLVLQAPDLPANYGTTAGNPCTYTPIAVDAATRSVWGEFSCNALSALDGSGDRCGVGPSYYFFENCTPQ